MFRKYLIPVAIASILISYIGIIYIDFHPKEYQVEVMFSNGTVDTLTFESSSKPFLKYGSIMRNVGPNTETYASGVYTFKILTIKSN